MSLSLSQVTSLFGTKSSNSTSGNLLDTLYSFATQSTGKTGLNPITALDNAEANQTQDIKATAAQPAVQRAVATFNKAVAGATSVQQLLNNPTVMQVLLTANGLADQIPYTALAQKTLMSNINDSSSLANKLTDTRWAPIVKTYDFANKGLSVIQNPTTISTIDHAYAEVSWRKSLDAATPGLSNALTFRAEASTIRSVDQILGDPIMRAVVTTALGIPLQIAFQPLEAQEKAISSRLDITQFQKPQFVDSFTQRYLIAAQSSSSTGSTGIGATLPSVTDLATQAAGLVV
jgi:Protein of unknown function (DUF1217)